MATSSGFNPDDNYGPSFVAVSTVLFWLAFIVCGLRIFTRIGRNAVLGVDDYLISVATVSLAEPDISHTVDSDSYWEPSNGDFALHQSTTDSADTRRS